MALQTMCIWFLGVVALTPNILIAAENSQGAGEENQRNTFWGAEWYVSLGCHKTYWQPTNIHVLQHSLGNDFTIHGVQGEDAPQWDSNEILQTRVTNPQFSIRIGRFFNRFLGLELSYDHTKYNSVYGQTARMSGTLNGKPIDTIIPLDEDYFIYRLHNGVNHWMINAVQRLPLFGELDSTASVALLLKEGVGIVLPHASNYVMGEKNTVGTFAWDNLFGFKNGWWRLGGWTVGVEAALRFVIYKPFYLEFADKETYARLENIPVYEGTAKHDLWMNEWLMSLGYTFNSL